jgi:Hint domain
MDLDRLELGEESLTALARRVNSAGTFSDRRRLNYVRRLIVAVLLLTLTACGSVKYDGGAHPLTTPELKYRLIDKIGPPLFCGPPVVRMPSDSEAQQEVAALKTQDPTTFDAIVRHEKLDAANLTANDDRRILQQVQVLQALQLGMEGGHYRFDYIAGRPSPEHVVGTIDDHGAITLETHDPTAFPGRGGCPICLAAGDRIATPDGEVPVTQLQPGMLVWTIDAGHRVAAPISVVGHTPAPFGHRVIRVVLADGRAVVASPGHPTADGRRVGELKTGDLFDGSRVTTTEVMPYVGDTWDLLPLSSTGEYWANGVLLASTLANGSK